MHLSHKTTSLRQLNLSYSNSSRKDSKHHRKLSTNRTSTVHRASNYSNRWYNNSSSCTDL